MSWLFSARYWQVTTQVVRWSVIFCSTALPKSGRCSSQRCNKVYEISPWISWLLWNILNLIPNLDLLKSCHLDNLDFCTDTKNGWDSRYHPSTWMTSLRKRASHWTDSVHLSITKIEWPGRETTEDHLFPQQNHHTGLEPDLTHWIGRTHRKHHIAGIRTSLQTCPSQSHASYDRTCPGIEFRQQSSTDVTARGSPADKWLQTDQVVEHDAIDYVWLVIYEMYVESWTQLSVDWKIKVLLWLPVSGSTSNSDNYRTIWWKLMRTTLNWTNEYRNG